MPDQIYIGNFAKGLKTDRLPFNIDNDSFPFLYNFYSWRGRIKRKRGTLFLAQLKIQVQIVAGAPLQWQVGPFSLSGGSINLITALSLPASSTIAPGSISFTVGGNTFTEPATPNGTLIGTPGGTGTINYATGVVTISAGGGAGIIGTFSYFPSIPVLGLEDFASSTVTSQTINPQFPQLLAFDQQKSYQIVSTNMPSFYNVSYYKNTNSPLTWNGQDYQQFWTTNYSGALWATNGNPGLHMVRGTYISGSASNTITFNFTNNFAPFAPFTTLVVGDVLWFNEWPGTTTINQITGTVTSAAGAAGGNYVVTFSQAVTVSGTGVVQTLTSSTLSDTGVAQDGIRWYDGDPTSATGLPTGTGKGWVNFAPPLTALLPPGGVIIDNSPSAVYYLVGALAILPFKDRLLFIGPIIQSSTGTPITLRDTILWSWNGTPYYTVSTGTQNTGFTPSLVPINQVANPAAYYVDQTGFGGYLPAGIAESIVTISNNEDVLLVGFGGDGRKTRFVYTGNDIQPFLFYNINSELPSSSTFSAIAVDKGMIDLGQYGICITDQQSAQRIDLDIPDTVFQVQDLNFGPQRVNAIRDFFREWIYFSYPYNDSSWKFPTRTLLYNYRDHTWGVFYENFTCHGRYRPQNKRSWLTLPYSNWNEWREPWNSGDNSPLFSNIIAGNPQGYVLIKGNGTGEGQSGTIQAIANSGGLTQITSTNHCLEVGDYIYITNALGVTPFNTLIGQVTNVGTPSSPTTNTFICDIPFPSGSYLGLGQYTRLIQPFLQTKQFPFYWDQGRQTRLGTQKYLMDKTTNSQVTVQIFLSQDPTDPWSDPNFSGSPNGLVYSEVMYTCPEGTNLVTAPANITPANVNLQMPTAQTQFQIWHRSNTSLMGDSVQIGITLSDAQMRNFIYATDEISLHGMHLTVYPGPALS